MRLKLLIVLAIVIIGVSNKAIALSSYDGLWQCTQFSKPLYMAIQTYSNGLTVVFDIYPLSPLFEGFSIKAYIGKIEGNVFNGLGEELGQSLAIIFESFTRARMEKRVERQFSAPSIESHQPDKILGIQ